MDEMERTLIAHPDKSCRNLPPNWFFEVDGVFYEDRGRTVCVGGGVNNRPGCPALELCREVAINNPHAPGIWGGLNEHERSLIRKQRKQDRQRQRRRQQVIAEKIGAG